MKLLDIAHAAITASDVHITAGDCYDLVLPSIDGWQVCFFIDCGDLDYIDHFITPDGEMLQVWPGEAYQSEQWPPVMNWRGPEDTERFRQLLAKEA